MAQLLLYILLRELHVIVLNSYEENMYMTSSFSLSLFLSRMIQTCHDDASRFVHILSYSHSNRNYLIPEDFEVIVQVMKRSDDSKYCVVFNLLCNTDYLLYSCASVIIQLLVVDLKWIAFIL